MQRLLVENLQPHGQEMFNALALVGALLPDYQIGVLSSKDVVDDFLPVDLHEIPLQLIHEGVEELVHISLDARVDRLPIQDKSPAQALSCIHIVVRVLEMREDLLNLIGDVLLILDIFGVDGQQGDAELGDIEQLLQEGVDVASGR